MFYPQTHSEEHAHTSPQQSVCLRAFSALPPQSSITELRDLPAPQTDPRVGRGFQARKQGWGWQPPIQPSCSNIQALFPLPSKVPRQHSGLARGHRVPAVNTLQRSPHTDRRPLCKPQRPEGCQLWGRHQGCEELRGRHGKERGRRRRPQVLAAAGANLLPLPTFPPLAAVHIGLCFCRFSLGI